MAIAAWMAAGVSAAAAVAAGGLLRSQYERRHFVTETFTIQSAKVRRKTTLVFLTDLHNQVFGEENALLVQEIDRIHPDYILSGGDSMVVKSGECDCSVPIALFETLSAKYPIICANGNHETRMKKQAKEYKNGYKRYQNELKRLHIRQIENGSAPLNEWLTVSSVELENRFYRDFFPDHMEQTYLESRLGKAEEGKFQILLLHSPLFFRACREWGADLTLSGHFHGGTIRLPLLGGVMTPQYQFFHPKCAGFFKKQEKYLLVGRGLGTHSINIRIGNLPQLVEIRLLPEEERKTKRNVKKDKREKKQK